MVIKQQEVKFYGGIITRVLIVYQKDCAEKFNQNSLDFIKTNFNSIRNYREFTGCPNVETREATSDHLPRISTLKEGDACLLIGSGRAVDKASYEFAKKCYENGIPVFFIRSNSADYDHRAKNLSVWKSNTLVVQHENNKTGIIAPKKYFMEIPSIDDFILIDCCDNLYALLPGMVPSM